MAKQDGQETVAKRDPQNWHRGWSVEVAAPQFGQLRVPACMLDILSAKNGLLQVEGKRPVPSGKGQFAVSGMRGRLLAAMRSDVRKGYALPTRRG